MKRVQTTLCAIDHSESSELVIQLAALISAPHRAQLFVVHVVDPDAEAISLSEAQFNLFRDRVINDLLTKFGVESQFVNVHGDPAKAIVEFADDRSIDLIVMGTHGRTGFARMRAGSVAHSVMKNASCQVAIVNLPNSAIA